MKNKQYSCRLSISHTVLLHIAFQQFIPFPSIRDDIEAENEL